MAVAAFVLAAALVALTRGGSPKGAGKITFVSPPTPTTVAPVPFPASGSMVNPGFYVTSRFQPQFTTTLDSDWKLNSETERAIELEDSSAGPGLLSVLTAGHPLDRDQVFATADQALQPSSTEAPADDAVEWLRSHRDLSVTPSVPATLLGASGVQVEVTVIPGHGTGACDVACVPLFQIGDDGMSSLAEGNVNRVYAVKPGGVEVLVVIGAPPEAFGSLAEKAERLVGTMSLVGSVTTTIPSTTVPPDDPATNTATAVSNKGATPPPTPLPAQPAAAAPLPTTPPTTAAPITTPPTPPTPPTPVSHAFPESPNGRYRAVSTGINYQVIDQTTGAVVLTTVDVYNSFNDVKLAAFSADSTKFAVGYHHSENSGFTLISTWRTSDGTKLLNRVVQRLLLNSLNGYV